MTEEELPPVEVLKRRYHAAKAREAGVADEPAKPEAEKPVESPAARRARQRGRRRAPVTEQTRVRLRKAAAKREAKYIAADPDAPAIARWRHARHLSQPDLAIASGVALRRLQYAEAGMTLNLEDRERLAKALGCDAEALR